MTPILTVTLNPALDVSTEAPNVRPGPKLRCAAPVYDPGGGGINISRAIKRLGGQTQAFVALGGATGTQLAALLSIEGIAASTMQAPGETRSSIAVTDTGSGAQYRFVLPGPFWDQAAVDTALHAVQSAAKPGGYVVVSGSQPPGVPDDFLAQLAKALAGKALLVADTSGAPLTRLAATANSGLALLRMDAEEAEELAGKALPDRADSAVFAAGLVAKGVAAAVLIARGADGSVLANPQGRWFCAAPKVPVKSKVGAGDSFVAGYVLTLARGQTPQAALACGMAAASAAVMTPATELCRREDVETLIADCPVSTI